ncbi:hypothetical protein M7I_3593 [Glarea lozoyensis 74030]|uniref:Uncharacterized protein n=1 Tax=Glarea lozoyensis (strain ATCC 74030 / MF5533) TaxID=1104152 RepID=H0ELX0_GLAL7|nr:hypothetical protein M7I_3593 [Glarea lozoyensis 74030]
MPDGNPDDVNIATELLTRPRIPHRQTSFSGTSLGQQSLKDSQFQDDLNGSIGPSRSRRALQSSNTWTSSSGELLSEQDEIEDRVISPISLRNRPVGSQEIYSAELHQQQVIWLWKLDCANMFSRHSSVSCSTWPCSERYLQDSWCT